jgi:hypothetical protein
VDKREVLISEHDLQQIISDAITFYINLAPSDEYHSQKCLITSFTQFLKKQDIIDLEVIFRRNVWK